MCQIFLVVLFKIPNVKQPHFFSYTYDEIMSLMVENEDGKMEFPQDVMLEDCFTDMKEVSFGFATNVTLVNETACVLDVECTINGTSIKRNNATTVNVTSTAANITESQSEQQSLNITLSENNMMNNLIDELMSEADDPEGKSKIGLFNRSHSMFYRYKCW